jgi:hypothetical protein
MYDFVHWTHSPRRLPAISAGPGHREPQRLGRPGLAPPQRGGHAPGHWRPTPQCPARAAAAWAGGAVGPGGPDLAPDPGGRGGTPAARPGGGTGGPGVTLIEDCLCLRLDDLLAAARQREPAAWARWSGTGALARFPPVGQRFIRAGMVLGAVGAVLTLDRGRGEARLCWRRAGAVGLQRVELGLVLSPLGLRWRWLCPLEGHSCRHLYLPPGAQAFASRQGYHLRYRSQGEPLERIVQRAERSLARAAT